MFRSRRILVQTVVGVVLSLFLASLVFAADQKSSSPFGTVDLEKAFNDYDKKKQLDQELGAFGEQLRARLDLRNTHKLLTQEEFGQLAELSAKSNPTDADKSKVQELMDLSKQREKELEVLRQKQGPTDQEKIRLQELQDQEKKSGESLKEDTGKYEEEFTKRRIELSRQVMQEVEATVSAIAKVKGFSLVFNKSAGEPGLIVYSSVDITDEVLKKLNKSK